MGLFGAVGWGFCVASDRSWSYRKPENGAAKDGAHSHNFLTWLFIRMLRQLLSMTCSSSISLSNVTSARPGGESSHSPASVQDCTRKPEWE